MPWAKLEQLRTRPRFPPARPGLRGKWAGTQCGGHCWEPGMSGEARGGAEPFSWDITHAGLTNDLTQVLTVGHPSRRPASGAPYGWARCALREVLSPRLLALACRSAFGTGRDGTHLGVVCPVERGRAHSLDTPLPSSLLGRSVRAPGPGWGSPAAGHSMDPRRGAVGCTARGQLVVAAAARAQAARSHPRLEPPQPRVPSSQVPDLFRGCKVLVSYLR